MKVFFTLDTLSIGGTERSTLDILSHFSKDTHVKVIYFYKGHELKEAYEKAGIPLNFVGLPTRKSYIKGIKTLVNIIRTEKPDIVVSSIARADLLSRIACFITGTPIIGTFVNDSYGDIRVEEHKKRKTYIKFVYAWSIDKLTSFVPKYWIANCKSIAFSNAKALGLNLNKLKVIYRGRETAKFPIWKAPEFKGKIKFVFVGRLMERKGLYELLEVAKMLNEEKLNFQLDIFGGGNIQADLQKIIVANGLQHIITLHGTVQQGWKKIYEGHCFVFPSWYEGFSGSLVEAMITGIPIIASDIPMNREAVTDGKTALLFKVKDKEQLFNSMKKVITNYDDVLVMGKNARSEALSRFDINIVANQYETFLKSVVNQKVDATQLLKKED
jgi:glycosyltransferase involved in cell wall biosynthesis